MALAKVRLMSTETDDRRRRRTERRRDVMRTVVVDAVIDLLLQSGNRAMTMDEIADAADVSTASLYQYFPGKANLMAAVADRVVSTDAEYLNRAFDPRKAPLDELTAIGEAYLEFGLEHPGHFQLVAHPAAFAHLTERQAFRMTRSVSEFIDRVADVIRRGQDPSLPDGERFPAGDLDPRTTAEALHAAWNGLLWLSVRDDRLQRTGDQLRALAEVAARIVRRGLLSDAEDTTPAARSTTR